LLFNSALVSCGKLFRAAHFQATHSKGIDGQVRSRTEFLVTVKDLIK